MKNLISTLCVFIALSSQAFAQDQDHDAVPHDHPAAETGQEHADSIGSPMPNAQPNRTVRVTLNDQMKIVFDDVLAPIHSGEIIQFVVTNEGKIPHEFAIASETERQEHAEMMRNMPGMEHSDGSALTLQPGTTASLTWHFEGDDEVVFSCNIPGHYEAGMFQELELEQ